MKISTKSKILRVEDIYDGTDSTGTKRPAPAKQIKALNDLITILNGNNTVSGSVLKSIKDAIDPMKGTGWTTQNLVAVQAALDTLNGIVSLNGSVLTSIKDNAAGGTYDNSESGMTATEIQDAIDELKTSIDYILASQELDMGIEFTAMPATVTGTRKLSNTGKTFRVNAGSINTDPYPLTDVRYQFPYNKIRTAKISATGTVAAYIDEPGFSAATGEVMVWLPKTYYRQVSVYEFEFSAYQRPGYVIHPLFWDYTDEVELDGVWISAFKASLASGGTKLQSQPAATLHHSIVMYGASGFRGLANAIGTGWGLGDLALRDYLRMVFLMAAASWDSQTVVGKGCEAMRYSADDKVVLATSTRNDIIVTTTTAALYNVGEYVSLGSSVGATTRFHSRAITAKKDAGKLDLTATANADTVTVNGTTYTKVASDPGATDFVNAAGLVAILDAIEGMDAIATSEVVALVCDTALTVTFSGANTTYTAYKSVVVGGTAFNAVLNDVLWHCAQVVSETNLIAMGNESGYIGTNGRVPVSFFGIWDLWGNMWEWVDGCFKHDTTLTFDVASAADTDYITINGTTLTKGAAADWTDAASLAAAIDALAGVTSTALGTVATVVADAGKYVVGSRTNVAGTITMTTVGYGFFYTFDTSKYAAIINTVPGTIADYTRHATALPLTDGYLGEMEGMPAVPKTLTGGGSATGTCDMYYQTTGYRGLIVGGRWNNTASNPGFWFWVVDSAPDASYVYIGARLLFRP
jgi:hypothetical protein